jgi:hypothetical protein
MPVSAPTLTANANGGGDSGATVKRLHDAGWSPVVAAKAEADRLAAEAERGENGRNTAEVGPEPDPPPGGRENGRNTAEAVKARVRFAYADAMADLEARLTERADDPEIVKAEIARLTRTERVAEDGFGVVLRSYADIEPKLTRWVWERKLPLGALSLLIGTEGLGKTAVGLSLAAQITRGELAGDLRGEPADVALFTPEDDAGATIWARLKAAGADLARVHDVTMRSSAGSERGLSLPDDTSAIVNALIEADVRFAFADPLASMLDPRLNSWKDTDVRSALEPLVGACAEHGITLLGTLHTNKTNSTDPRQRGMGSAGWQQIARAALLVSLDPDDPAGKTGDRRCLAHTKHNLGPWTRTRRVTLATASVTIGDRQQDTVRASVGEECDVTAGAMLAAEAGHEDAGKTKEDQAARWLRGLLTDGPRAVAKIEEAAETAGYGWRTVERAKKDIGAKSTRESSATGWSWRLTDGLPV